MIVDYAGLVPIAQQSRKPIFDLEQADGIGAGQIQAVARCRDNFTRIGTRLPERIGIEHPQPLLGPAPAVAAWLMRSARDL